MEKLVATLFLIFSVVLSDQRNETETTSASCKRFLTYEPGKIIRRYIYNSEPRTWDEAVVICSLQTSHLAIINSEEEKYVIQSIVINSVRSTKGNVLLGFHDRNIDGSFQTVLGQVLQTFNSWSIGEESKREGMDCGAMDYYGSLIVVHCDSQSPFLCELYENIFK